MAKSNPSPSCFVAEIDLVLADKLRADLIAQGFKLTQPQYTVFSAQKKNISCTLYTSGKLTVQGKDKDEFINFYLEPEILRNFSYSYPEANIDMTPRIGVDEAGKGDFFGPLCIGAVQADAEKIKKLLSIGVRDSKKMSDASVIKLARLIQETVPHTVIRIYPKKYNELYASFRNLNQLLAWGHATAIAELVQKTGCENVIIDQFASEHLVENALAKQRIKVNLTQRHRGEEDLVVAAASILARSAFLDGLEKLGAQVGFTLPKGASAKVVEAGKTLVSKQGKDILETVAKLHFKTTNEVLV